MRFPEIENIDFLNEEGKQRLISHLERFRKDRYITSLLPVLLDFETSTRVEKALIETKIVNPVYTVYCQHCGSFQISNELNEEMFHEFRVNLLDYQKEQTISTLENLMNFLEDACLQCEKNVRVEEKTQFLIDRRLRMNR